MIMMNGCCNLWNMRAGYTRIGNVKTIMSRLMMKISLRGFVCGREQCSLYYV
nr:unnamed protein product [Callosobruchus chinensis]